MRLSFTTLGNNIARLLGGAAAPRSRAASPLDTGELRLRRDLMRRPNARVANFDGDLR